MKYFEELEAKNTAYLRSLVSKFAPAHPPDELCDRLNSLFHVHEARLYDGRHPEIFGALPGIWHEMLDVAAQELGNRPLNVVDLGCGTGFEVSLLLQHPLRSQIRSLTLFDASVDMLAVCRAKIAAPVECTVVTTTDVKSLEQLFGHTDLVLTNAVLHHIPRLQSFIRLIADLLRPAGIWINGHEPSSRFYRNSACVQVFDAYLNAQAAKRSWKYADPRRYLRKALKYYRRFSGGVDDPHEATIRDAVRLGLFGATPNDIAVSRLIDYWVANDENEAVNGRGFDFEKFSSGDEGAWQALFVRSYNHFGYMNENEVESNWSQQAEKLRAQYPLDGASYSAVWRARSA
jgi:predicted TPR repeat methyltransferase